MYGVGLRLCRTATLRVHPRALLRVVTNETKVRQTEKRKRRRRRKEDNEREKDSLEYWVSGDLDRS